MKTVDTRGLSCPQPLMMVHPFLSGKEAVEVLVDNEASRENVTRAAQKAGWTVVPQDCGDGVTRLELNR